MAGSRGGCKLSATGPPPVMRSVAACMAIPEKLPIRWMPDLHTSHVGCFNGSDQFFLAHHRVALPVGPADYIALYCFDRRGILSIHKIRGPLERVTEESIGELMARLGQYEFSDICVAPFEVRFEGQTFGLIPDAAHCTLTLQP